MSHSTYCGEYTLPLIAKAAITKKPSWNAVGVIGARSAITVMSASNARNVSAPTALSASAGTAGAPHSVIAYQKEPKSIPRAELKE